MRRSPIWRDQWSNRVGVGPARSGDRPQRSFPVRQRQEVQEVLSQEESRARERPPRKTSFCRHYRALRAHDRRTTKIAERDPPGRGALLSDGWLPMSRQPGVAAGSPRFPPPARVSGRRQRRQSRCRTRKGSIFLKGATASPFGRQQGSGPRIHTGKQVLDFPRAGMNARRARTNSWRDAVSYLGSIPHHVKAARFDGDGRPSPSPMRIPALSPQPVGRR